METKIKILFIGAYERGGTGNRFYAPQLGLERLASYMRSRGMEADIFDPNFEFAKAKKEEEAEIFIRAITEKAYDIYGFHTTDWTFPEDMALIETTRKSRPAAFIMVGGQEATFNYKEILKNSAADMVIRGEGEKPLEELANLLVKNIDPKNPKNLVRGGAVYDPARDSCVVRANPPLSFEEFSDITMGIDFSKIPYEKYWNLTEGLSGGSAKPEETRTIRLFTTNFCPHRCTFCSSTNFQDSAGGLRKNDAFLNVLNPEIATETKCAGLYMLSAENLYRHVKSAIDSHPEVRNFILQDDEFVLNRGRVIAFSKMVIEGKRSGDIPERITFMCQSRIDDITEELLANMAEADFKLIGYGVESFSEKILSAVKKKIKPDQINRAVEMTIKSGITPFINLIIFFPQADRGDIMKTVSNALNWIERGAQVAIEPYLMPLSGAEIVSQGFDVFYKEHTIDGKKFKKGIFLIPGDPETRAAALAFKDEIKKTTQYFAEKHDLKFLPTRLRSLFTILTVCLLFEEKEEGRRTEACINKILSK